MRRGIVGPRIPRPETDGLPPEESKRVTKEWREACQERWKRIASESKGRPETAYRSLKEMCSHFGDRHDYQLFKRILTWRSDGVSTETENQVIELQPGAHMLQALGKDLMSKGFKRFRKRDSDMPLRTRSGDCFELGSFGARGRNTAYYDCQIRMNGLKIRGRLPGKKPTGRILEGVAITCKPDGWYAAIREVVTIRVLPEPTPGKLVGIDVGLVNIAALSDGTLIRNPRGAEYVERIAGRQAMGLPTERLQQKAARQVRHVCYNLAKSLERHEIVAVERLSSRVGQMGSSKVSVMRTLITILQNRLGSRVREVDCSYTSQDCSRCGKRSKETWSFDHGRIGHCPACGHSEDRDLNAARNVLSRYLKTLEVAA